MFLSHLVNPRDFVVNLLLQALVFPFEYFTGLSQALVLIPQIDVITGCLVQL
jgi:hypothetical protein